MIRVYKTSIWRVPIESIRYIGNIAATISPNTNFFSFVRITQFLIAKHQNCYTVANCVLAITIPRSHGGSKTTPTRETRRRERLIRLCSRWRRAPRTISSTWTSPEKWNPWRRANTTSLSVTAPSPLSWRRFTTPCCFMPSPSRRACRRSRMRSTWTVVI